jgi:hypothetical protein
MCVCAQLLADDADMSKMYLSQLMRRPALWDAINSGSSVGSANHEEVECLLEVRTVRICVHIYICYV